MSSEELRFTDLRSIDDGRVYILPNSLPGECLEDQVRTLHIYQINK